LDDIASMAEAAGTFVAGYLAQGAKQLGDKVRDGAVERLWQLIEPRLRGTPRGTAALENLAQQPDDAACASTVGAIVADFARADPAFAAQLRTVIADLHRQDVHSQGGATAGGSQINIAQGGDGRFRTRDVVNGNLDRSKHVTKIRTGGHGGIIVGVVALLVVAVVVVVYGLNSGGSSDEVAGKIVSSLFPKPSGESSEDLARQGGGGYHTNSILPTDPYFAVTAVYTDIAQNLPDHACARMREDAQSAFAADENASTCTVAASALARQVTAKNAYVESIKRPAGVESLPTTITINSCDSEITGGPALGVFILTKVERGQWLITGHSPGPAHCPGG
jgi:hypothetical protein